MRIIETKVFKLSELSEDAKKKAIEKFWDINVNYEWWEFIYEDAKHIGIQINSFDLDRKQISGEYILHSGGQVVEKILMEHGEETETYKTAKRYKESFMKDSNDSDYEESEDEFLNDILEDYRIMLQKNYDYYTSEEAIIETIEVNEYEFTEDGNLF